MNSVELEKKTNTFDLDDASLQIVEKNEITADLFIVRNATMCTICKRNALLGYEYEFTCYVCESNVGKTKNQLTKVQRLIEKKYCLIQR